jgi:hypothetical protein
MITGWCRMIRTASPTGPEMKAGCPAPAGAMTSTAPSAD